MVKRGFQKGEVLAIYIPDLIEYPIIFHGVACLGGVATTLNPLPDSIQDLACRLNATQAKYLVTVPSLAVQAFSSDALKGIRSVFVIGEAQGCESISALLSDDGAAFPKNVQINPKEDVVALLSSSGTTGIPKLVMVTHYNLIAEICPSIQRRSSARRYGKSFKCEVFLLYLRIRGHTRRTPLYRKQAGRPRTRL